MEETAPPQNYFPGFGDIEEKQRLLKDRLLLIGQNLIELKEKNREQILDLKKEIGLLKISTEKIKDYLETISGEFEKFAKKDDLNLLAKQAKIFQPLEFVKKSELHQLGITKRGTEKLKKR